jgi:AcrR family transcriptional regulator
MPSHKKSSILDAATRLFASKGFTQTSIQDIARLAGSAEGTIFYHYKSKEELLVAVLDNLRADLAQCFQGHLAPGASSPGFPAVEDAIAFYFHLASIKEYYFLLLQNHHLHELARENPACREQLEAIYTIILGFFESAILKGQQDGSLHTPNPGKTALLLFTMVDGLVRLRAYNLYEPGALFADLIEACGKILNRRNPEIRKPKAAP